MGLSASQARLLSITQRLSNNELESEIIANSKMRLAEKNTIASEKYIAALDSTKMTYVSYDDKGIQETVALTFNTLNQYTPLKNQYGLYNSEGQLLVNQIDADNFAKSTDLYSFLDCYGLFDQGRAENAAAQEQYNQEKSKYDQDVLDYNDALQAFNDHRTPEWTTYLANKAAWETAEEAAYHASPEYQNYLTDHENWVQASGATNPYTEFTNVVGTSDHPNSCYSNVINDGGTGTYGCFIHVLAHLIDLSVAGNNYNTTTGKNVHISQSDASGSGLGTNESTLKSAREAIQQQYTSSGEYIVKCDGDDDLATTGNQNSLKDIIDAGGTPKDLDILMSDYYIMKDGSGNPILDDDGNKTYGIKSVFQKAVDIMYILKNRPEFGGDSVVTKDLVKKILANFVDGDMANMNFEEPQPPERPNNPCPYSEPVFTLPYPEKPTEPIYYKKIYDKPLAQWYTNLWYAMDGQDKSDVLYSICDENASFSYFTVPNADRISTIDNLGNQINQYYKVIDSKLASDTSWIQFALNNGLVSMKQASIRTNGDITWAGIEASSTSDIYEVDDNTKIAKAEAEYNQSRAQIQAEDKKFDAEIKKLDTEHSALQTEVESIKTVMSKNVENSFSVFS